jgi:uncharacterized RDD family membrane protein YckC
MDVPDKPTEPAALKIETPAGLSIYMGVGAIVVLIPLILFHLGAGVLSYQKYGSIGWAFLDFIFAYFYYPYYALVLSRESAPAPMMGGMKGNPLAAVSKMLRTMMK